jgi:GcrA cell cycle regulator
MPVAAEKSAWTSERVELLKQLCEGVISASEIATEINLATASRFSRNAVISKMSRMELSKPVVERQPHSGKKTSRPRKPRNRRLRHAKVSYLFEEALPPADFLGIPFSETTQKTCMYPEGDGRNMLFCGQPRRDGSSYCEAHRRICYWKPDRAVYIGRAA